MYFNKVGMFLHNYGETKMENMTDALNNIKKIEAMQNEITNIITRPNTKLDEDCREAFVALGTARTKLANLFFQLAEEKGAA